MVAVELEVLAKKFDRFGWDRDIGTAVGDRQVIDWMDALQDYPLDEIRAACRAAVLKNPNKMPNEGHIRAEIIAARALKAKPTTGANTEATPSRKPVSVEERQRIVAEIGLPILSPDQLGAAKRITPSTGE